MSDTFYIFIYNKGQMYLPQYEKAFGSEFLKVRLPHDRSERKESTEYRYAQDFMLKRTLVKALDKDGKRCDQTENSGNTTKCISEYLEREIGCTMHLHGSNSQIPRCYQYFYFFCSVMYLIGSLRFFFKYIGAIVQSNTRTTTTIMKSCSEQMRLKYFRGHAAFPTARSIIMMRYQCLTLKRRNMNMQQRLRMPKKLTRYVH